MARGTITGKLQSKKRISGNLSIPSQRVVPGDYNDLMNKPSIESVELIGNKTFKQLGMEAATVQEVEAVLYLG